MHGHPVKTDGGDYVLIKLYGSTEAILLKPSNKNK